MDVHGQPVEWKTYPEMTAEKLTRRALLERLLRVRGLTEDHAVNVFLVATGARRGARIELRGGSPRLDAEYVRITDEVTSVVQRFQANRFLFVHFSGPEPFFCGIEVARSRDMTVAARARFDEESYETYSAIGRVLDYETVSKRTFRTVYTSDAETPPSWEAAGRREYEVTRDGRHVFGVGYAVDLSNADTSHIESLASKAARSFAGIPGYAVAVRP